MGKREKDIYIYIYIYIYIERERERESLEVGNRNMVKEKEGGRVYIFYLDMSNLRKLHVTSAMVYSNNV